MRSRERDFIDLHVAVLGNQDRPGHSFELF